MEKIFFKKIEAGFANKDGTSPLGKSPLEKVKQDLPTKMEHSYLTASSNSFFWDDLYNKLTIEKIFFVFENHFKVLRHQKLQLSLSLFILYKYISLFEENIYKTYNILN